MRVAGLGFRSAATVDDLHDALHLAGGRVDLLATDATKAKAPALTALATRLNLPIRAVRVAGQPTPSTSPRVQAKFATGSLSEAAALVAAGPGACLVTPRVATPNGMATAAIAEGISE
ncbi:cobalamin biosynthesis protein [Fuscibacter oryzae]|uniref:Cobalamin biosynthesis protein n=1 Tax=Fuscibacter oryzae TaxID=2803939 RepID=A0A8J7SX90_9RHOB|nr:cobalamin biosynthesis protein [Fuscibacter oryzae]MBL4929724.1 cobalamin biosynthesis protein [Fuscibacter oryzae]